MITVEEANQIIQNTVKDFGIEQLDIEDAIGRILRESFITDRDLPPYNRVTMDGIAIAFEAYAGGGSVFPIAGIAAAGAPRQTLEQPGHCLEIMTGAILPDGTDTVIRYEDVDIENNIATIKEEARVKRGQNIHIQGEDRKAGSLIVKSGKVLGPAEIGVAATIGKKEIKVSKPPTVAIISTGDELIEIEETPLPHQIRRSNVYRLMATLKSLNVESDAFHLLDDLEETVARLGELLEEYDVLLLSGGVSKGKFDFLPPALERLGVKKLFHKIKQRPGKPFWFGKAPNGTLAFALPGNPVSSFLCTHRYFIPWLKRSLQQELKPQPRAALSKDFTFKPDLTYFLQVRISYDSEGRMLAEPVEGHGSGDLANLVDSEAFIELARGKDLYKAGEVWPVYFF